MQANAWSPNRQLAQHIPAANGGGVAGSSLSGHCVPVLLAAPVAAALSSPVAALLTASLVTALAAPLAARLDRVDCRTVVLLLGCVHRRHGSRLLVAVEGE